MPCTYIQHVSSNFTTFGHGLVVNTDRVMTRIQLAATYCEGKYVSIILILPVHERHLSLPHPPRLQTALQELMNHHTFKTL